MQATANKPHADTMQTETTERPAHLFTGVESALYDTRQPDPFTHPPLRPAKAWQWHHREIKTGRDLRASLRAGDCTWPGCYPIAYACDDGGTLCPDCVRANLAGILDSIRTNTRDGWRVVGLDVPGIDHDSPTTCDHCNAEILNPEH
jgi:hypothetical protein